ncbi:Gfo/Idh/MocA family protein [Lichenicoccus roseus]|uniref:Gfo/Idh/MocA family oxidoreductase n=1 Tax=Lichenicoccus roseus TaxID=2683649 RepID=A0A5R9JC85_9PROT|nr:Gfo/Idh/MocA family oxidoreductase [Lichenicoccus roseus]TLU74373.1 Gfo/Idh/MocA family oxidoreductase [Lichenicoccus roseus]
MNPVNVALVGFGWWGRKMSSLIRSQSQALRLVAVVEPDIEAARNALAGTGIGVHAGLAEALGPEVEAVILATPHSLHEQQIAACVAAGKHVFCEKPLALTRAGAAEAVRRCREAGLVLGMGHERRFEPPIAALLAAADAGELGTLLQIEANFSHDKFLTLDASNWRLHADQAPAGGMTATGIHLTDLAVRLLGSPETVLATSRNLVSELPSGDTMSAYVRFRSGATAYISATLATPFVSRFAVFGSKGWVDVRDRAHVEAPDGWIVTTGRAGEAIRTEEVGRAEPVLANLEAFARAVRGEAAYPITGEQMIDNISLLESIVHSCRTGAIEAVA